jgi:hypothetical protein
MYRTDFVSNSSSSSFVLDSKQEGLKDFFKEFKKLFGKLHDITCIFNIHKVLAKPILEKVESYTEIQNWIKDTQVPIYFDERDSGSVITFAPQMLDDDLLFDICWQIIEKCDQIEIGIRDTWGPYNFAMHQILTLLEYKGFDFIEGYSNEGWVKMGLKKKENNND